MKLAGTVLVAAALLLPAGASAKCAGPGAFLVPDSGDLPADPTLHFFVPGLPKEEPALVVTGDGGLALPVKIEPVEGSPPAFRVFRVEIETGASRSVEISYEGPYRTGLRTYRIDPKYAGAPRSAVQIDEVTGRSYQWTCSYEETRRLVLDTTAPLYRVEWADSEGDFYAGPRRSVLLPHRIPELTFRWADSTVPDAPLLPLGHVDCLGETFRWKAPVWAAVIAVYPDGSETPLGKPERLEPPEPSEGKGPNAE